MKQVIISVFCFVTWAANATWVEYPLKTMFSGALYGKQFTIQTDPNAILADTNNNFYIGSTSIVNPTGGTNPIVWLEPNCYVTKFTDAGRYTLHICVPNSLNVLNAFNLVNTNYPVTFLSPVPPYPIVVGGTNVTVSYASSNNTYTVNSSASGGGGGSGGLSNATYIVAFTNKAAGTQTYVTNGNNGTNVYIGTNGMGGTFDFLQLTNVPGLSTLSNDDGGLTFTPTSTNVVGLTSNIVYRVRIPGISTNGTTQTFIGLGKGLTNSGTMSLDTNAFASLKDAVTIAAASGGNAANVAITNNTFTQQFTGPEQFTNLFIGSMIISNGLFAQHLGIISSGNSLGAIDVNELDFGTTAGSSSRAGFINFVGGNLLWSGFTSIQYLQFIVSSNSANTSGLTIRTNGNIDSTGVFTAGSFAGVGSSLTSLSAANMSSGNTSASNQWVGYFNGNGGGLTNLILATGNGWVLSGQVKLQTDTAQVMVKASGRNVGWIGFAAVAGMGVSLPDGLAFNQQNGVVSYRLMTNGVGLCVDNGTTGTLTPFAALSFTGSGSGLTNGFQNTVTYTNFLLSSSFTNTTTRSEFVTGNFRATPTTTGQALVGLVTSPTGATYTTNAIGGIESDVIFSTAPHGWYQLIAIVPPNGIWKFVDISGEGNVMMTNSFYQTLQ